MVPVHPQGGIRAVSDLIESGRLLYLLVFIAFSSINRQPLDRKML